MRSCSVSGLWLLAKLIACSISLTTSATTCHKINLLLHVVGMTHVHCSGTEMLIVQLTMQQNSQPQTACLGVISLFVLMLQIGPETHRHNRLTVDSCSRSLGETALRNLDYQSTGVEIWVGKCSVKLTSLTMPRTNKQNPHAAMHALTGVLFTHST